MMFFSPFELFTSISDKDVLEFKRIKSLPRRTRFECLKFELEENKFNINFLTKVNESFFRNIIEKLNEKSIYLKNELSKELTIEKPIQRNHQEIKINRPLQRNERLVDRHRISSERSETEQVRHQETERLERSETEKRNEMKSEQVRRQENGMKDDENEIDETERRELLERILDIMMSRI